MRSFPMPESAFTVMVMTSCAAAAPADLDSLYRGLRAARLHPLRRIEWVRISRLGETE
jgi:hypothetical protein